MSSVLDFTIGLLKKNRKGITINKFQDALADAKLLALGQDGEYVAKLLADVGAIEYDQESRIIKLSSKENLEQVGRISEQANRHRVFARHLFEATVFIGKYFKLNKDSWRFLNTDDQFFDGKSPIELIWWKGREGFKKVKEATQLIYTYQTLKDKVAKKNSKRP